MGRLAKQPFGSSEATSCAAIWTSAWSSPGEKTRERVSVEAARRTLDKDHFGLEKVKERILEFLAVEAAGPRLEGTGDLPGGPPGVGKTSVAMSVAQALNRKLARLSLGGVSDEAEIRGSPQDLCGRHARPHHLRHQSGGELQPAAAAGRDRQAGPRPPGDPASALLEVLDAEQNSTFRDNFWSCPSICLM